MAKEPEFYTLKEVASILRVSMTTIHVYARRKDRKQRLPIKRFGRSCIRVPRKEFMLWAGITNEE